MDRLFVFGRVADSQKDHQLDMAFGRGTLLGRLGRPVEKQFTLSRWKRSQDALAQACALDAVDVAKPQVDGVE